VCTGELAGQQLNMQAEQDAPGMCLCHMHMLYMAHDIAHTLHSGATASSALSAACRADNCSAGDVLA
jgi:hypothetical protein